MSINELQALKVKLPHGWTVRTAKELGYCKSTITNMMNGKAPINVKILDHLVQMAEEHTNIKKELKARINRLNSKN